MMVDYNTIEFRDKLSEQYNRKIHDLLLELPQYCSDYELYARSKNAIKTRMEYLIDINNFFRYLTSVRHLAKKPADVTLEILENIKGTDWDNYKNWLSNYKFDENNKDEKYKTNCKASVKRKLMAIKSLYHFLYIRDYISHNPSEKMDLPVITKKKRASITVLSDEERNLFLNAIDQKYEEAKNMLSSIPESKLTKKDKLKPYLAIRDKAIVAVLLGTGLRVSELCAINCSNIAYQLGIINVYRKGDDDSKETTDQVYLQENVMKILLDYITVARDQIGADEDNYDALFLSSLHKRITPRAIELMVKEYADKALGKDNNIHPHTLRATFGTNYYKNTKDISKTATAMNHSGIEVTARYYLQEDKDAKQLAQQIDFLGDGNV